MNQDNYGHRLKAFSLRMEKEQRAALETQAKKNGRTLTAEINFRLTQSIENSENGKDLAKLEKSLAEISRKLDKLRR